MAVVGQQCQQGVNNDQLESQPSTVAVVGQQCKHESVNNDQLESQPSTVAVVGQQCQQGLAVGRKTVERRPERRIKPGIH